MKKVNALFPWANGKDITDTFNKKKVERVGEAPPSDGKRKKVGKQNAAQKKAAQDVKNKSVE